MNIPCLIVACAILILGAFFQHEVPKIDCLKLGLGVVVLSFLIPLL